MEISLGRNKQQAYRDTRARPMKSNPEEPDIVTADDIFQIRKLLLSRWRYGQDLEEVAAARVNSVQIGLNPDCRGCFVVEDQRRDVCETGV
ncbi:hypothetical protein NHX12_008186 [Muraenolepis orangiensis]|uniref:Uncharacterized protein n=1 Tax=Muraenolepis orangiensis TaxID=630683 RepID=A0A9Q0I7U9_9TELE|nr:hypothetical protein NHX12_008186 [Muraenolepis orangiensis]